MNDKMSVADRIFATLASLRLTVFGLFLLLILTVWGTLYQTDHGLYGAQQRFYQTWYFMVGGVVPFPGAQAVMTLLFVNLVAAMGRIVLMHRAKWGLLVTHAGLLLMLVAGGVTFYFGEESHLALTEGETSNVSSSSREWELALWPAPTGDSHHRDVTAISVNHVQAGDVLTAPVGGISMEVQEFFPNASFSKNGLQAIPPPQDPSDSMPGLVLNVRAGAGEPARVTLWGGVNSSASIEADDGAIYALTLRRRKFPLPAAIELVDFQRVMHPGSGIARSFSSQVIVRPEEGPERRVLISMNKPLRTGGFTFYQSSYMEGGGREVSVLAVVKNYGRLVPYIATGMTFAGMVLHYVGMMMIRMKRMRSREAQPA